MVWSIGSIKDEGFGQSSAAESLDGLEKLFYKGNRMYTDEYLLSLLGDYTPEKICDRPIKYRNTGRSQSLLLWRRSPLQMLHDWQGDRPSEKSTRDRASFTAF